MPTARTGPFQAAAVCPTGPAAARLRRTMPMSTIYFQRATEDEPDITIMDVPRNGKTLADMVQERIGPGSTVMTDEHTAYKNLKERGYDHHTVNHGEGEYASGECNETHTNNCECRIGLFKWWMKKTPRRQQVAPGVLCQVVPVRAQPPPYGFSGRFVATLAMVLDRFEGVQA